MDEKQRVERQYLAALEEIDGLLRRERTEEEGRRLDALADFVESYEDEHYPIPDMSDAEADQILGIDCSDIPEITELGPRLVRDAQGQVVDAREFVARLPLAEREPNEETAQVLREAGEGKNLMGPYATADEMFDAFGMD